MRRGVLLVAALLLVSAHARIIVHGSHEKPARIKHPVKDVESRYHVSAEIMDLTQQVQELPEQNVPLRKAAQADLEEEEEAAADPTRAVMELPEQTLQDPGAAPPALPSSLEQMDGDIDLERDTAHRPSKRHHRKHNSRKQLEELSSSELEGGVLGPDPEEDEGDEVAKKLLQRAHEKTFENSMEHATPDSPHSHATPDSQEDAWKSAHPAYPARVKQGRSGVRSDPPDGGRRVEGGDHWATPGQRVGDYMPPNFVNPLLMNSRPPVKDSVLDEHRVGFDKENDVGNIEFDSGDYHFNIHHNQGRNFLDANRVQIGTSRLGAHSHDAGAVVAKYRIRFANEFVQRPIVIVTTVPASAEDVTSMGSHPDVFVASVSEIRLDSFTVNVVRVDSLPNNSWGQDLYLDWIAIEYDGNYPNAGPASYKAPYLDTYPSRDHEEQGEGDVVSEAEPQGEWAIQ